MHIHIHRQSHAYAHGRFFGLALCSLRRFYCSPSSSFFFFFFFYYYYYFFSSCARSANFPPFCPSQTRFPLLSPTASGAYFFVFCCFCVCICLALSLRGNVFVVGSLTQKSCSANYWKLKTAAAARERFGVCVCVCYAASSRQKTCCWWGVSQSVTQQSSTNWQLLSAKHCYYTHAHIHMHICIYVCI